MRGAGLLDHQQHHGSWHRHHPSAAGGREGTVTEAAQPGGDTPASRASSADASQGATSARSRGRSAARMAASGFPQLLAEAACLHVTQVDRSFGSLHRRLVSGARCTAQRNPPRNRGRVPAPAQEGPGCEGCGTAGKAEARTRCRDERGGPEISAVGAPLSGRHADPAVGVPQVSRSRRNSSTRSDEVSLASTPVSRSASSCGARSSADCGLPVR